MGPWGIYQEIVDKLAMKCGFTSIRNLRNISGRSGAQTFLVQPESNDGNPLPAILKVGSIKAIECDVAGLKRGQHHFDHANLILAEVTDGDLRAVLLQLAGGQGGRTFEEYYLDASTTPAMVGKTVGDLFNVMRVVERNVRKGTNPFFQYSFRAPDPQSRALRDIGDRLPTSIRWWEKASDQSHFDETYCGLCHGDLHRKNILVSGDRVFVIDFGLLGDGHALRDFAKIERDVLLFLYPVDSKDYSQHSDLVFENDLNVKIDPEADQFIQKAEAGINAIRQASRLLINDVAQWRYQYRVALLAQMIFAASDETLARNIRGLAMQYAWALEESLERENPKLGFSSVERRKVYRKDILWRFAYVFLRLDQLPSGGWGKSLPGWFEALVEADNNSIPRSPETRKRGGTDLTIYGFIEYLRFQARLSNVTVKTLSERISTVYTSSFRDVSNDAWENLKGRIGWDGGIGTGHGRANDKPSVRHSAFGLVGALIYSRYTGNNPVEEIRKISNYLNDQIHEWEKDTTHLFGSYCALAKLRELLPDLSSDISEYIPPELRERVGKVLREIAKALMAPSDRYTLKPRGTYQEQSGNFPFHPYSDFWRMERSNLIMHAPFLLNESHADFHDFVDRGVKDRCLSLLKDFVRELQNSEKGIQLCFYYRDGAVNPLNRGANRPTDWGLTAELLTLVSSPALQKVEDFWDGLPDRDRLLKELTLSLVDSFDQYHDRPELFKFTHATSFGRFLLSVDHDTININAVMKLDELIKESKNLGNTECSMHCLCEKLLKEVNIIDSESQELVQIKAMRDLLVDKLEGGEHVEVTLPWIKRVEAAKVTTVNFFNGKGGLEYADYYLREENVIHSLVTRIPDVLSWPNGVGEKRVLDVGCGPGQYARLLVSHGFSVELLDASHQMLKIAHKHLQRDGSPPAARDITDLDNPQLYKDNCFDLLFACAIMVHVPHSEAPEVLRCFYRILRPGGALFVNFKVGDHTLLGLGKEPGRDDRYFEYYRHHSLPWTLLEESGFSIDELALRWNHKNMYHDPKKIHWANFYCTKRSADS